MIYRQDIDVLIESKSLEASLINSDIDKPTIVVKRCSSLKNIPNFIQESKFLWVPNKMKFTMEKPKKRRKSKVSKRRYHKKDALSPKFQSSKIMIINFELFLVLTSQI